MRDDLDMWRAKVSGMRSSASLLLIRTRQASESERYRTEVARYRERLEDFDYLKKQVEVRSQCDGWALVLMSLHRS